MSESNNPKGSSGGRARAAALTPERRKEIARLAAAVRWSNKVTDTSPASCGDRFKNSEPASWSDKTQNNKSAQKQSTIATQQEIAVNCYGYIGISGLRAGVAIYQQVQTKDALANLLTLSVIKELRKHVYIIPLDYYKELYRLRETEFTNELEAHPQQFGHLTNDLIGDRLNFLQLSLYLGTDALREHIASLVSIMKLSKNWTDFYKNLEYIHPKLNSIAVDSDKFSYEGQ